MNPSIADLMASEPDRAKTHRVSQGGWVLDYSHLPLSAARRDALVEAFTNARAADHIEALFAGECVNPSEQQPALHTRLRSNEDAEVAGLTERFLAVAGALYSGRQGLSDVIHIGIGGSDLGPRLVADALEAGDSAVRVHWLSTVDGRRVRRLLNELDPATTGVVIASKSFSTEETLVQAQHIKDWLGERFVSQAWAATAKPGKAEAFGVAQAHILAFPSWTGGRFSLWSSVGVSAAALIGPQAFRGLLAGAHEADALYRATPRASDAGQHGLAVWLALAIEHLRRGLDLPTLGVVAYEPRLALLGDYCQQLFMESLGKRVGLDDQPVATPTVPLIYGGRGTDLQHSIFQALHQGLDTHPLLLVGALRDEAGESSWHHVQLAHLLAQRQAFARGRIDGEVYQHMPGNRPVALLLTEALTAKGLGFLLASLEHCVYSLSILWGVNAFDQWGVEEGKRLAGPIRDRLAAENPSLEALLDWDLNHH